MTEHMYFNASNPFPTLARGLFTEELEEGSLLPPSVKRIQGMQDRIVARGYDKFFNIDEVEWTNVSEV
jgi:tRNA ligase